MVFTVRNHRLAVGHSNVRFVRSPNTGSALNPKFLVIHYTASGPSFDTAAYFARSSSRVSAHLVIRRDGTVVQCVPFDTVGWHAGKSQWRSKTGQRFVGLNSHSIGIEIENWGPVTRTASGWVSYSMSSVDGSRVIEACHKSGRPDCGWETFTEAQIVSCLEAARAICTHYNIEEIVGHDDITPGNKIDPGPAWNMDSFCAKVFGRSDDGPSSFVVRSPTGLNLRDGPGASSALLRPAPLPDGTLVIVHQAQGQWRYVSVLNAAGDPDFSGWVHGDYIRAA